jgi:hypothetical protein
MRGLEARRLVPDMLFHSGRLARDKCSSSLLKVITYGRKQFYNIAYWNQSTDCNVEGLKCIRAQFYKTFLVCNLLMLEMT